MGWRLGFVAVLAELFCEGFVQPVAHILRKGSWLGVAENINGFARRIHDDAALLALAEVLFELRAGGRVQRAIQIFRELEEKSLTVQFALLP